MLICEQLRNILNIKHYAKMLNNKYYTKHLIYISNFKYLRVLIFV